MIWQLLPAPVEHEIGNNNQKKGMNLATVGEKLQRVTPASKTE